MKGSKKDSKSKYKTIDDSIVSSDKESKSKTMEEKKEMYKEG